jgi:hypothetical protein
MDKKMQVNCMVYTKEKMAIEKCIELIYARQQGN